MNITKRIHNAKISTKLMILGAVSVLGLFLLGRESIETAWQLDQVGKEMSEVWMNAVIQAEELNTATSDYRILESQHAITTDPEIMVSLEDEMDALQREIDNRFLAYRQLPISVSDQDDIQKAQAMWQEYLQCSETLVQTSRGNDREAAMELLVGESKTLFDEASNLFLKSVNQTKQEALAERTLASELYQRLSHMKLLIIAVVSLAVIVLIYSIIRAIKRPTEQIAEVARRATNGNLDVQIDYMSADEIGTMSEAMNLLLLRLRDIVQDEIRMFQEIGNRNFDVKSNCEQAYRGDFAPILYAFTSLQSRMKEFKSQQEEEVKGMQALTEQLQKKNSELVEKNSELEEKLKKSEKREQEEKLNQSEEREQEEKLNQSEEREQEEKPDNQKQLRQGETAPAVEVGTREEKILEAEGGHHE